MKVITIGNGFITSHLPYPVIPERLLPDACQIRSILEQYHPDVVVNCIAYCGDRNIDDCELQRERTIETNLTIPTILATECSKLNIHLIHIGSGCIFYRPSPNHPQGLWTEDDFANPLSFYSKTKYACDLALGGLENTTILRIRMPLSPKRHARNLISKLLKYEQVVETLNSVTFIEDLVRAIDWVIDEYKFGIYHVVNPTAIRHSQILEEYRKYRPEHNYTKINPVQLQSLIRTPRSNCLLSINKITEEGFSMTPTMDAVEYCIAEYTKGPSC